MNRIPAISLVLLLCYLACGDNLIGKDLQSPPQKYKLKPGEAFHFKLNYESVFKVDLVEKDGNSRTDKNSNGGNFQQPQNPNFQIPKRTSIITKPVAPIIKANCRVSFKNLGVNFTVLEAGPHGYRMSMKFMKERAARKKVFRSAWVAVTRVRNIAPGERNPGAPAIAEADKLMMQLFPDVLDSTEFCFEMRNDGRFKIFPDSYFASRSLIRNIRELDEMDSRDSGIGLARSSQLFVYFLERIAELCFPDLNHLRNHYLTTSKIKNSLKLSGRACGHPFSSVQTYGRIHSNEVIHRQVSFSAGRSFAPGRYSGLQSWNFLKSGLLTRHQIQLIEKAPFTWYWASMNRNQSELVKIDSRTDWKVQLIKREKTILKTPKNRANAQELPIIKKANNEKQGTQIVENSTNKILKTLKFSSDEEFQFSFTSEWYYYEDRTFSCEPLYVRSSISVARAESENRENYVRLNLNLKEMEYWDIGTEWKISKFPIDSQRLQKLLPGLIRQSQQALGFQGGKIAGMEQTLAGQWALTHNRPLYFKWIPKSSQYRLVWLGNDDLKKSLLVLGNMDCLERLFNRLAQLINVKKKYDDPLDFAVSSATSKNKFRVKDILYSNRKFEGSQPFSKGSFQEIFGWKPVIPGQEEPNSNFTSYTLPQESPWSWQCSEQLDFDQEKQKLLEHILTIRSSCDFFRNSNGRLTGLSSFVSWHIWK